MIALITDFGADSYYVGLVHAAIKKENPGADIINITHSVEPQSILNAQYILLACQNHVPEKTIFYIVVDPGVGTERNILIAQDQSATYVVPDNGIISAIESPELTVYSADTSFATAPASTFHGRDVIAPITARLDSGSVPEELGRQTDQYIRRPFYAEKVSEKGFRAHIAHIDRFGNCILNILYEKTNLWHQNQVMAKANGKELACTKVTTYAEASGTELIILKGSSGFVELAHNQDSAATTLHGQIGTEIEITYA